MQFERHVDQAAIWPTEGRHILAQYDDASVFVYQAYSHAIADHALSHQRFGGPWSFSRMSWVKPNFLWMMFRCGWAEKPGQERVLAIRLAREGFDELLAAAVHSSHVAEVYGDHSAWALAVKRSDVRLQWDPDHNPHGHKLPRRAVQLGLRGATLERFATDWCLAIEDLTDKVREQHAHVRAQRLDQLETPRERVYPVRDPIVATKLGLA